MRDRDTVACLEVLYAVADSQYYPSSLVPDDARKLGLDGVQPAGDEQIAIIDGRVLNADQHFARFGMARFGNLHEAKPFLGFTVFRQMDGLHRSLFLLREFCYLSVSKLDQINAGEAVSDLLCAAAFAQRPKIDDCKAESFQQDTDLAFGVRVVA